MKTTFSFAVLSLFACSAFAAPAVSLPDSAEAAKVAGAWLRSVSEKRADDVVKSSDYPFRMLGFESPACKGDRTARDEASLRPFIKCVIDELVTEETQADLQKADQEPLTASDLKRSGWRKQRKALQELQRTERLVWRIYQDEDVLHIVVLGVRQTPNGPRVSTIAYHTDMVTDK
jgi:hypothetical protein